MGKSKVKLRDGVDSEVEDDLWFLKGARTMRFYQAPPVLDLFIHVNQIRHHLIQHTHLADSTPPRLTNSGTWTLSFSLCVGDCDSDLQSYHQQQPRPSTSLAVVAVTVNIYKWLLHPFLCQMSHAHTRTSGPVTWQISLDCHQAVTSLILSILCQALGPVTCLISSDCHQAVTSPIMWRLCQALGPVNDW